MEGQVVEVCRLNRKDGRDRRPNIRIVALLSVSVVTKITGHSNPSIQPYLT